MSNVKPTRRPLREVADDQLQALASGVFAREHALSRLIAHWLPARFRVTALVPIILACSLALWSFGSSDLMDRITPWIGAGALLFEGCYLGRVVIRIGSLCRRHAAACGSEAEQLRHLRRTVLPALNVLFGTVIFSGVFGHFAQDILSEAHNAATPRLLWVLTIGGLVLALFFGELVTRLIDIVELDLQRNGQPETKTSGLTAD